MPADGTLVATSHARLRHVPLRRQLSRI